MTNLMDDGSREQLAAALLGWNGERGRRSPRDTLVDDDSGRDTPKAEPRLGSQGYIRGLMQYADDEHTTSTDDDIDADSVVDTIDSLDSRSETSRRRPSMRETTAPAPHKPLLPLPVEAPLASPPLAMSCRISRFPFSHLCDMPELMPDQDDMFAAESTPTVSGPATPSIAPDIFRTLAQDTSPDLELGPFPPTASEREFHDRMHNMSIKSAHSEASGSNELRMIREEIDDLNEDGVSMMTPTERSFGDSNWEGGSYSAGSERAGQQGCRAVGGLPHAPSVSSLGSAGSGSSEWRPSHDASVGQKSGGLFSRIRNGARHPGEGECIDHRSLTPVQLSIPSRAPGHTGDDLVTPVGPSPSPSLRTRNRRAEGTTASRFFHRMPWLSDSQAKRPESVFGSDLKESIRIAPIRSRISHKGQGTSFRTFPLSVYKCCEFIRRAGGTNGDIFSTPGDAGNVGSLRIIFSEPPLYGEDFQFEGSAYTVYDAASLILLFLEALPKPLISPSVIKSWILLARQEGVIEPPCPRLETALDFWTEALNRLPTANRNLTKHLLTLFAEVLLAATGAITEADARQFASTVAKAMFHQDAEGATVGGSGRDSREAKKGARRNVQPTLALAFLIKKRGEYAASLDRASGSTPSLGSKGESKLFLPSTKEIMEWKGMSF